MLVYVSKVFTAAQAGRQLKEVNCEKCGKQFFYELSRIGVGSSSAPYMLGQNSAQTASQKKAVADLQKRLMHDQETVPCPACQWVNVSAIESYRKTKRLGWTLLGFFIGLIGFVVSLVVFGMSHDVLGRDASISDPVHWIIAAIWITLMVACFLAQWALRRRIDLNRTYNGKKRLPAGTPPAIVPTGKNAEGEIQYEVVPYDLALIDSYSKWAIFRAGQFSLLPLCCRCLGEPSTSLKLPFVRQAQPIPVPICKDCRKAILRNWWVANLVSLIAAFGTAWILLMLPKRMDDTGRIIFMIFVGILLAGIGFCAIDELIRPYKHVAIDAPRGISKIRFRNPAYTALLIRKVGEADGYFKKTEQTP